MSYIWVYQCLWRPSVHRLSTFSFFEQGHTISSAYYAGELRPLRQEIARKMRGKLTRGALLLQENAPAHTSQVAMTAATECGFQILPHPPYSPDVAPSDFYLFPKLKSYRGTQYGGNEVRGRGSEGVLWGLGKCIFSFNNILFRKYKA